MCVLLLLFLYLVIVIIIVIIIIISTIISTIVIIMTISLWTQGKHHAVRPAVENAFSLNFVMVCGMM